MAADIGGAVSTYSLAAVSRFPTRFYANDIPVNASTALRQTHTSRENQFGPRVEFLISCQIIPFVSSTIISLQKYRDEFRVKTRLDACLCQSGRLARPIS